MAEWKERHDGGMQTTEESLLCMACGLCCDGTLFAAVSVEALEFPVLRALPVTLATGRDGRYSLVQPCPACTGSRCEIYDQRPGACLKWECYVLEGYRRGAISMDEALDRIGQAHALKADLMEALQPWEPGVQNTSLPALWRRWNAQATGVDGTSFRLKRGDVLMRIAVLNYYLERYFRPGEAET